MRLDFRMLLLIGLWSLTAAFLFVVITVNMSGDSFSRVPWGAVIVFMIVVVFLAVGSAATFMAIRSIPHLGWVRLLIVLSIVSAILGCFYGIDQVGRIRGDDYFEVAAYTMAGPIIVVWSTLAVKRTIEWILAGFGGDSRR